MGTAATAAASPTPVPSVSKAEDGQSAEDKENDAAAVTAVIWKELAEMSAAQAKLRVRADLFAVLPPSFWFIGAFHK